MNAEDFRLLYDYNSWANHRTLDACAQLTEDLFTRDMGSSFRSVRDTLVHVMLVEWLWLERWHGRSPNSFAPASQFPNLGSVRARWTEIDRDLRDYIASLTPEEVQRVVAPHNDSRRAASSAALANVAAPSEPRHLSSRPSYNAAASIRSESRRHRSDYVLSRTAPRRRPPKHDALKRLLCAEISFVFRLSVRVPRLPWKPSTPSNG